MKKPAFKVGQRIKTRSLRGTVLSIYRLVTGEPEYAVRLDNGINAKGTKYQFEAVRKA